jgi:hypothetical protein
MMRVTLRHYWAAVLVGTFLVSLGLWWAGWMSMATGRNIQVGLALVTFVVWRRVRQPEQWRLNVATTTLAVLMVLSVVASLGLWVLQQSGVGGG